MTTAGDPYSDWDAAYVLGSLPPAQRHEFELHLEGCLRCAAAVAEFAALPGLLSRVRPDEIATDEAEPGPPVSLLPRLVHAAVRHRRLTRALVAGMVAAAAAIALVIPLALTGMSELSGPVSPPNARSTPATELALSQVVASPLHADARLVEYEWGTRIDMNCRYAQPSGSGAYQGSATQYALYVTDTAGTATELGSWVAMPGSTVKPSATTSLPLSGIRSVEVRAVASGQVLLRGYP